MGALFLKMESSSSLASPRLKELKLGPICVKFLHLDIHDLHLIHASPHELSQI